MLLDEALARPADWPALAGAARRPPRWRCRPRARRCWPTPPTRRGRCFPGRRGAVRLADALPVTSAPARPGAPADTAGLPGDQCRRCRRPLPPAPRAGQRRHGQRLAGRADRPAASRQVALKLPHGAWLARRPGRALARERDILATLEHPHIARLYDAGVAPTTASPGWRWRRAAGASTTWCRAARPAAGASGCAVPAGRRAVAHAHAGWWSTATSSRRTSWSPTPGR
jgi:hypothetical protein